MVVFFSFLFLLKEKETKSSSEFDEGEILVPSFLSRTRIWESLLFEGLKVEDSASCYYRFAEGAVFFTACFWLP
jgi:hypothetical protein